MAGCGPISCLFATWAGLYDGPSNGSGQAAVLQEVRGGLQASGSGGRRAVYGLTGGWARRGTARAAMLSSC